MTFFTWTGNVDQYDHTSIVLLRDGGLVLRRNQWADLSDEEVEALSTRLILTLGQVGSGPGVTTMSLAGSLTWSAPQLSTDPSPVYRVARSMALVQAVVNATVPGDDDLVVDLKRDGVTIATVTLPAGVGEVVVPVNVLAQPGNHIGIVATNVGASPPTGVVVQVDVA
jgi:hypothetical protein